MFYLYLVHYTVIAQWRMHMIGQSEWFTIYTISIWIYTVSGTPIPYLFVGLYLFLFVLTPFIMFFGWMVNIHTIKFTLNIVLGTPPPSVAVTSNIFLKLLDAPILKIVKSLKISFIGYLPLLILRVWVLFDLSGSTFTITEVLVISNLDRKVVSARISVPLVSVSQFLWFYNVVVIISRITNEFYFWYLYACISIILCSFNQMIENWVRPW